MLAMVAAMSACSSDADDDTGEMTAGGSAGAAGVGGATGGSSAGGTGTTMGGASMGGTTNSMAGAGSGEAPSFSSDVWPILTANCGTVGCHGDGSFLPEHANSDVNVAFEEAQPKADLIAGRVSGALMPIMPQFCGPAPGLGECLSIEEVRIIEAWVAAGAEF